MLYEGTCLWLQDSSPIHYNTVLLAPACDDGQVRLMNRTQPIMNKGRVEICYNNTYGTICDDFFDEVAASIVCGGMIG